MKKAVRFLIPAILVVAIVLCLAWYLLVYDRSFTRDALLGLARYSENQGSHNMATWFYNLAYSQAGDNDAVAIELAEQYKSSGNYTKAEYTLSNAIADGGGIDLYIALCKTYVEQDKLLDAVTMLDSIMNSEIKAQLDIKRPSAPRVVPAPGFYNQYISVKLEADGGTIYASASGEYPSTADVPYAQPIALSDGENTIYALTIADNGLVSPLSVFGYTVGGVIELVNFNDEAVEAEIRKLLNVSDDKPLYTNDLWAIKSFTVPSDAKNYADLKHMAFLEKLTIEQGVSDQVHNLSALTNLTDLQILNTPISQDDLTSIAVLPKLKNLTLENCNLSSITALQSATELVTLNLNNNTIGNIEALSGMHALQELNLQHNAVADLSPISSITALVKLDVSYNSLTSLAAVSSLTNLTWLDAGTNSITDLGELGKLTSLTDLSVSSNKLTQINALSGCNALTNLNVSSNTLSDISIVGSLKNIMYLDFSYNQVKDLPKFSTNCALVTIDGSNNKISKLDNLSGLKNLNIVDMDYNTSISSVKPLAKCPVLIKVNVYATKVKDVTSLTNQSIIVNYKPV